MKIVFVTTEFVSEGEFGGGLASYLNNITKALYDRGHDVTVITLSDIEGSIIWNGLHIERVKVMYGKLCRKSPWITAVKTSFCLNKRLRVLIRNGMKFDVVQYSNYNALGLFRTSIPTVVRLSSDSRLWREGNRLEFDFSDTCKHGKTIDFFEDLAVKRSDVVYGPSKAIADIVSERTKKSISIVESPVILQTNKLDDSLYTSVMRKPYILTYGQLSVLKGIVTIGDAIYDILDRNKELYYVFAGPSREFIVNGKVYSSIEYLATKAREYSDRIIYLGIISRDVLYPIIKAAKLVVLPSRIDNLPNTCIEAMFFQKIVIGTAGASFEQLINDGKNGVLIERDSADALSDAVRKILDLSPQKIEEMGRLAKKRVDKMAIENIVKLTLKIYQKAQNKADSGDYS